MKKIFLTVVSFLLIGNVLVNCESSDFEQEKVSNIISSEKSVTFPMDTQTAELIGKKHNDYCLQVINSFKTTSKKITLKQAVLQLNVEGLSYDDKVQIYNSMSALSEQQIEKNVINWFKTKDGVLMFNKITSTIDNATNYPNLANNLNLLQKEVKQKITNIQERQVLDVYIEVSKNSAYLWFPVTLGGSGLGDDYIKNSSQQRRPGWIKADGQAAGQAMISWALTGGLGGPVGFLGATVIGGVLGSVSHGGK